MNWNERYAAGKGWPHPLDDAWDDRLWDKTQEGANGGGVYTYRGFGELPDYKTTINHWVFTRPDGTERHEAVINYGFPGDAFLHLPGVDGRTLPELKQHAENMFKRVSEKRPELTESLRKYWGQRYAIAPQAEFSHITHMTPREILSTHEVNDAEFESVGAESNEDFWNKKLRESHESGLYDDIDANGVKKPIAVIHYKNPDRGVSFREIFEGHHRLISAFVANPDKPVPVRIMHDNPYFLRGSLYEHGSF